MPVLQVKVMGPPRHRLNTTNPGGRNVFPGARINQAKKKPSQNNILGSGVKNKSFVCGKVIKRNSGHLLRKNNIALAKALNASKQQIAELTTLAMQYRERAHAAERQVQRFQNFKQDMQSLLNQYSQELTLQDGSDASFSETRLQISVPARTENECHSKGAQYDTGFRETRTQLVNPMVQGMSINKVKVRLERINDLPRTRACSPQEQITSPASSQRRSLQSIFVNNSPNTAAEMSVQQESQSPVDEDITVDLAMQLRPSRESFSNNLRVMSLTLQRLSLQDIQRTSSAAYMMDTPVEVPSTDQSPNDQSSSVQLGQSMFPAVGDRISSRQSAHATVDRGHDATRESSSPKEMDELMQQLSTTDQDPLEGTSWMHDTTRLTRRIKVRSGRSLHPKSPKREAAKRRYTVRNLAAKNTVHAVPAALSPPASSETAIQDMSLTLCFPLQAVDSQALSEAVKSVSVNSQESVVDADVSVASESSDFVDPMTSIGRKSPTVAVTRLFEADIFRLSAANSNSSSEEELLSPILRAPFSGKEQVLVDDQVMAQEPSGKDNGSTCILSPSEAHNPWEEISSASAVDEDGTADDEKTRPSPETQKRVSETMKVLLTRVDDETNAVKRASKRGGKKTTKSKTVSAPVVRLPSRQAKQLGPGIYKEASLHRKLRR